MITKKDTWSGRSSTLKQSLLEEYEQLTLRYLYKQEESLLYEASILSKKFVEAEIGPDELIQHHFKLLEGILDKVQSTQHKEVTSRLADMLLESTMVYSQSHQEVRRLLAELQKRYTELTRAKSELERSQRDLREKTAILLQTEKMTALGELTAGIAHELNQPLNAVMLISEDISRDITKDRLDQEQLKEGLQEITYEIKKMAEIIGHMRIFTRKTTEEHRETINASSPIEGVLKLLGQQLVIRNIQVNKEVDGGLFVMGNPVRLEQVMMNLITNARDAVHENNREKGKQINLRVYLDSTTNPAYPSVIYEIGDNGMGIPAHLREKIFEPFFTRKPPGEGTGLGLSVAAQIIKEHGGTIEVSGEEGEGSLFRIRLPAIVEKSIASPHRESSIENETNEAVMERGTVESR